MNSNFPGKLKSLGLRTVLAWGFFIFCATAFILTEIKEAKNHPVAAESFYSFDTSELSGRIKYLAHNSKKSYFNLDIDSTKYYQAVLIESGSTDENNFNRIALVGDSIVKHKHSSILILFTQGQIRYFFIPHPQ